MAVGIGRAGYHAFRLFLHRLGGGGNLAGNRIDGGFQLLGDGAGEAGAFGGRFGGGFLIAVLLLLDALQFLAAAFLGGGGLLLGILFPLEFHRPQIFRIGLEHLHGARHVAHVILAVKPGDGDFIVAIGKRGHGLGELAERLADIAAEQHAGQQQDAEQRGNAEQELLHQIVAELFVELVEAPGDGGIADKLPFGGEDRGQDNLVAVRHFGIALALVEHVLMAADKPGKVRGGQAVRMIFGDHGPILVIGDDIGEDAILEGGHLLIDFCDFLRLVPFEGAGHLRRHQIGDGQIVGDCQAFQVLALALQPEKDEKREAGKGRREYDKLDFPADCQLDCGFFRVLPTVRGRRGLDAHYLDFLV